MNKVIASVLAACLWLGAAFLGCDAQAQGTFPGFGGLGLPYVGAGTTAMPTWGGDVYFNSGRPWCDVRAKGAAGNGTTLDTAAFAACNTALSAFGGGTLYVPCGTYLVNGTTALNSGVWVVGEGQACTIITTVNGATSYDVTVFSCAVSYVAIENLTIYGKGVNGDTGTFGASNPVIALNSGCGQPRLFNIIVQGGSNTINSNGAFEQRFWQVTTASSYGAAQFYLANSDGARFDHVSIDHSFPFTQPSAPFALSAWQSTHAYAANSVVSLSGWIIQCGVCGTSGGSSPTLKNYGISFSDGSISDWRIMSPTTHAGLQLDTGAAETFGNVIDLTGAWITAGLYLTNTLSGAAPTSNYITHSVFAGSIGNDIVLTAGSELTVADSRIVQCLVAGCNTVSIGGSWTGQAKFTGNRVVLAVGNGITINGGTENIIANNVFDQNGTCVGVAAGVSGFAVTDNICDSTNTNGVTVAAGASDNYRIANVDYSTNGTSDAGTGNHKTVWVTNNTAHLNAVQLGFSGVSQGGITIVNATSGSIQVLPATGALGTSTITLPAITDTMAGFALANGGTNNALTASNGGIVWSDASKLNILSGTATARQMLLSGASATPAWSTATMPSDVAAAGQVLNATGAHAWGATATPTLGVAGSALGTLTLAGNTSGSVLVTPQAAAGSPTLTLPNASGTFAVSASAPLAVSATTGNLTCSTCATTTNGGALSGTSPITLSVGGAIGINTATGTTLGAASGDNATLSVTAGAFAINLSHANTWAAVQTFNNGDLALVDASAAHNVLIQPNSSSALTVDRILTLDMVNGARTLKLGANLTLASDPGAVSGAMKSNGTGTFAQAACADLSNGATGCSTATGTSGATLPLLNGTNTWSGAQTLSGVSLTLSGAISASAWTTAGVRYKNVSATLTDTSSSGTVATAYTDFWPGDAIAASSVTTFTNYFGAYHSAPTAGSNVTLTNAWALGADSVKIGTSNQFAVTATGFVTAGGAAANGVFTSLGQTDVPAIQATGINSTGHSKGFSVFAGTNGSDYAFQLFDVTGSTQFMRVYGTGGVALGASAGTDPGNGSIYATGYLRTGVTTVGSLPTCNGTSEGAQFYVSDQNTAVSYRGAVTGGGATRQAVLCSNSAWIQD